GLALFGKQGQDEEVVRSQPFVDEEADAVLQSLGIAELDARSADADRDCGTSWLFVEPAFSASELVAAMERNWWPRLESHEMAVTVVDEDGVDHRVSAVERRELRPFVEAFHIAAGTRPVRDVDRLKVIRVSGAVVNDVGKLGLTVDLGDGGWSW